MTNNTRTCSYYMTIDKTWRQSHDYDFELQQLWMSYTIYTDTLYISNAQKNSILFLFRLHKKDHETWPSCFEKMFLSSLVFDDLGSLNKDYFKLRHLLHETCWITWARLVTEPVTYSCMWLLRYCAVIVNKQTACQHHTYIPWSFVFVVLKVVNVLKVCQFTRLQMQER